MGKTSLSAGEIIHSILSADQDVQSIVTAIYPVIEPVKAVCPYIAYRRVGLEATPQKAGSPGSDTVRIEVSCYALDYEGSLDLAEAVRSALDFVTYEVPGLRMRSCYLSESAEDIQGDAFVQELTFTIKI